MSKDKIKGGLADKMSKKDIADKFKVSLQKIEKQIKMGTDVEMEHVKSRNLAKEIAMDHLVEVPDYYTRLKKMEKEAKRKWNIKESTRANIKRLFRESVELETTDETTDSSTYRIMYNGRDAGEVACGPNGDMADTIELLFVGLHPDYQHQGMQIIKDVIHAIFAEYQDAQNILVTPKPESRGFWAKMGANRMNDSFMKISRGH